MVKEINPTMCKFCGKDITYQSIHLNCFTDEELADIKNEARKYCSLSLQSALEYDEELCRQQGIVECNFCQEKFCERHCYNVTLFRNMKMIDNQAEYKMCQNCNLSDKTLVKILFDTHGLEYTPQVEKMGILEYPFSILAEELAKQPKLPSKSGMETEPDIVESEVIDFEDEDFDYIDYAKSLGDIISEVEAPEKKKTEKCLKDTEGDDTKDCDDVDCTYCNR